MKILLWKRKMIISIHATIPRSVFFDCLFATSAFDWLGMNAELYLNKITYKPRPEHLRRYFLSYK